MSKEQPEGTKATNLQIFRMCNKRQLRPWHAWLSHRLSMPVVKIHIKALIEPDDQAVRVVSFQTFVNPRRGLYILA